MAPANLKKVPDMDYTPGQRYDLRVVFARPDSRNVTVDPGNGDPWFSLPVEGELVSPIQKLKDRTVSFVCREVTEKGPVFDLAPEYFVPKDAAPEIAVGAPARVPLAKLDGVGEGEKVEFKSSIVYSPVTHQPHSAQPFAIAKEIAAFMNTDGGTLYLGVKDDGSVCGVESDFPALGGAELQMPEKTDADYSYKQTKDGFEQKLRNLIRFYLGEYASSKIKDPEWGKAGGRSYVKLEVPATDDEPVYLGRNEHLVYRTGSESVYLIGRARDQYTKVRFHHGAVTDVKAMLDEFRKALEGKHIPGRTITVSGGQPFTKEAVEATKRPKSLAWDGCHYAEVSGWQGLVEKVLDKIQGIVPAKFDELAESKEFSRTLVKVSKPREKHPDCFAGRFGADGKIRVKKSIGNKVYLWNEGLFLRKFVAACGVDIGKFMFVPA